MLGSACLDPFCTLLYKVEQLMLLDIVAPRIHKSELYMQINTLLSKNSVHLHKECTWMIFIYNKAKYSMDPRI